MQLEIFTDGGSRGNPGDAAIGGVVYDSQKSVVFEFSKYIGTATNNEAEYSAVQTALVWLQSQDTKAGDVVICHLDSKLVVEQLNKNWKIKNDRMRVFAHDCWSLLSDISADVTFVHVRREKNKVADLLVNQALDAYQE